MAKIPDAQIAGLLVGIREGVVATIATAEAHVAQIDAVLGLLAEAPSPKCPHCGSARLIPTDEPSAYVCDVCTKSFTLEADKS